MVDFGHHGAVPCRMVSPIVDEIAEVGQKAKAGR